MIKLMKVMCTKGLDFGKQGKCEDGENYFMRKSKNGSDFVVLSDKGIWVNLDEFMGFGSKIGMAYNNHFKQILKEAFDWQPLEFYVKNYKVASLLNEGYIEESMWLFGTNNFGNHISKNKPPIEYDGRVITHVMKEDIISDGVNFEKFDTTTVTVKTLPDMVIYTIGTIHNHCILRLASKLGVTLISNTSIEAAPDVDVFIICNTANSLDLAKFSDLFCRTNRSMFSIVSSEDAFMEMLLEFDKEPSKKKTADDSRDSLLAVMQSIERNSVYGVSTNSDMLIRRRELMTIFENAVIEYDKSKRDVK